MQKQNTKAVQRKSFYRWRNLIGMFIIPILALLGFIYWQHSQENSQLLTQLRSIQPEIRQQALSNLRAKPIAEQQAFVRQWQTTLLKAFEQSINEALMAGQVQTAQILLADLQRLYPQLPLLQTAQQQVAQYSSQQINVLVAKLNQLLSQDSLKISDLQTLAQTEKQLQNLAANHALLYDKRLLYILLKSIDEFLAQANFKLAQQQLDWALQRYPQEAALLDRQVQLQYQLAGYPAQVLEQCINEGKHCWQISTHVPLFSQPWVLQNAPFLLQTELLPLGQEQLGEYYREKAIQHYNQQQLTLSAVNLLRAAYFTPLDELDKYWQWLAFAFKERAAKEQALFQEAQLSALQHTFLTQVAAIDVMGAQRSVVLMQNQHINKQFLQQVAFPMLGDTYLKLAQQLAAKQQYQLAVRLLLAGHDFLPHNEGINHLLAEYKQFNQNEQNLTADPTENVLAFTADLTGPVDLNPVDLESLAPTKKNSSIPANDDSCLQQLNHAQYQASYCQDQLANSTMGPALIIPPLNQNNIKPFAISKYPVTINDYNFYCKTTKACKSISVQTAAKKTTTPSKKLPGNLDLSDVENVLQDYDSYCLSTGNCNMLEPQAQDIPVTGISLNQALNYADWLSTQTGQKYRLPTLDEWQYSMIAKKSYQCSLTHNKNVLVPVQQSNANAWGIFSQLKFMSEWVRSSEGITIIGPETQEAGKCVLPIQQIEKTPNQTGFRLVREIQ